MNKKCSSCKEVKDLTEFNRKREGYQPNCRVCSKIKSKEFYRKNRKANIQKAAKHKKKIMAENAVKIIEVLSESACVDCGYRGHPAAMDFDHVRGKKSRSVSAMLAHSWANIEEEIAKCEIRCANCHRIKTASQLNWYSGIDIDSIWHKL